MTAIDWFYEQLPIRMKNYLHKEYEQAKFMEKQQIKDTYKFALQDEYLIGSESYYDQTYGKDNKNKNQ